MTNRSFKSRCLRGVLAVVIGATAMGIAVAQDSGEITHKQKKAVKAQQKADKKSDVAQAKADQKKTAAQSDANEAPADAKVDAAKKQ